MDRIPYSSLLSRVYGCQACPSRFRFTHTPPGGPYFKFPPTIGAQEKADLLFVGINPRLNGNVPLFERLMSNREAFDELARNMDRGRAYIRAQGGEPHYEIHMKIVEGIYGTGAKFEDHAAVTELYFCASADANWLPEEGSDCADEYFGEVLAQVQPKVIICLGERVLGYMQEQYDGGSSRVFRIAGGGALVICIPHPGNDKVTEPGREVCIDEAMKQLRSVLRL